MVDEPGGTRAQSRPLAGICIAVSAGCAAVALVLSAIDGNTFATIAFAVLLPTQVGMTAHVWHRYHTPRRRT